MKPPPPMLPARGRVTASAKPVATAASTALPPLASIARPASLASRSGPTTMSPRAAVGTKRLRKSIRGVSGGSVSAIEGLAISVTSSVARAAVIHCWGIVRVRYVGG